MAIEATEFNVVEIRKTNNDDDKCLRFKNGTDFAIPENLSVGIKLSDAEKKFPEMSKDDNGDFLVVLESKEVKKGNPDFRCSSNCKNLCAYYLEKYLSLSVSSGGIERIIYTVLGADPTSTNENGNCDYRPNRKK